jgi:hypothetical protein
MKISRLRKAVAALGLTLAVGALGGGLVLAQDKPKDQPKDQPADDHDPDHTAATPPPDDNAEAVMKKRANISPRDMTHQSDEYLGKMNDTLRHVVTLQGIAQRQKDVIKLNCVNDKLLQVKQLMNIAEGAKTNLSEDITKGDEDGRYHEFGRITIAQQQVQVLSSEADNCIGEDLSFLGPTQVIVSAPAEPDDPTQPPGNDIPTVEPLPIASPFI